MKRALLLSGLAVLMCASVSAQQARRAEASARPNLEGVYAKWLGEDVAYVITPEEKRAFTMLKSDKEREQFIDAFWRRRDPEPDTAANEYRDEHYERFAHANENFSTARAAGWSTDRGRIYIMYGKPHDVSKSTTGELWVYRYIPSLGSHIEIRFTLDAATGDFRLQQ